MIELKDYLDHLISIMEISNCSAGFRSIYDNIAEVGQRKRIWFCDMSKSPYRVKLVLDNEIDRFMEDYELYKPLETYKSVLSVIRKKK
jgi:hypothetical protein